MLENKEVGESDFAIVDGAITLERLPNPSWLIRRRKNQKSLKSEFDLVATLVQTAPGECAIKGCLARGKGMSAGDRRAFKRIGVSLKFRVGRYEKYDEFGNFVEMVEIWSDDENKKTA